MSDTNDETDVVVEKTSDNSDKPILIVYVDPDTKLMQPVQITTREGAADIFVMMEKIRQADSFKTYELTEVEI